MKKQNLVAVLRVIFEKANGQLNSSTLNMSLKKFEEFEVDTKGTVTKEELNSIVEWLLENSKSYKEVVNEIDFDNFVEVKTVAKSSKSEKAGTITQAKDFIKAKGLWEEFQALVNA